MVREDSPSLGRVSAEGFASLSGMSLGAFEPCDRESVAGASDEVRVPGKDAPGGPDCREG